MATKNQIKARRAIVLNLVCAGHTEDAIVQALAGRGISSSQPTVHRDIRAALGELHPRDEQAIEDKRALVDRRYEILISRVWPIALGTPVVRDVDGTVITAARPPDLDAVARAQGLLEAQRRLWGLDKAIDLGSAPGTLVAVLQGWAAANPPTIIENEAGHTVDGEFRELPPSPDELDDWEPEGDPYRNGTNGAGGADDN